MKRRFLTIFLAVLMALSVMLPLAVAASAASSPIVRLLYASGDESKYIEFTDLTNLGSGDRLTALVDTGNKTVFLRLKNYQADGGIYVKVPDANWSVFVSVAGTNTLNMHYNELTKSWMALGTNGALFVYPINESDSLSVTGNYGSGAQKALTADYYAFQAADIVFSNLSSASMNVNVKFKMNVAGYSSKGVYPFKADGKNAEARLVNTSFTYTFHSNYPLPIPEDTPIVLDGKTYFFTDYATDNASGMSAHAYHKLKYADTFTGLLHIDVTNGYYYGGPYSGEYNIAQLSKRYLARFDNIWRYHAIAKNCSLSLHKITPAEVKSAFSFPLAYGYKLPAKTNGSGFDARIVWTDGDDTTDLTGTAAEYGKKYKATISFVPYGFNEAPTASELIAAEEDAVPKGAYSTGRSASTVNTSIQDDFFVRYNALIKPALKITKQPEDYVGSGFNKTAYFTIDTNDTSAAYQWQMSTTGGSADSEWTDLADSYGSGGNIRIAGTKGKNLIYNFNATGEAGVKLRYFRCVVSRGTDKLVSKTVEYSFKEDTTPVVTVSEIMIGGFTFQAGAGDVFYNSPYAMVDDKTASSSSGGTDYKVQIVDDKGIWYEGEAGASSATPTADTKFAAGKTYTYRIKLKNTANSTFASSLTIKQISTGRQPDKITKYTDGTVIADFTFGPIGNVIKRIYLYNFVPPYNSMGTMYPTVRDDAGYKLDSGFTKGWYEDGSENLLSSSRQIGNKYYMNIFLYTTDGDEFAAVNGKPDASIEEIRDRDGITYWPDKIEYSFTKNSDGTPNYRYLNIKVTCECKETHITKGGKITDLDMPAAGQALDTEVTRETPQIDFQEMFYRINGERVDAATAKPEEGDIVDIVFTFKEYGEGVNKMHFDKDIYTIWYIGGNEEENAVKVFRDTSYGDETICAFVYTVHVPAGTTPPETDVMLGDVNNDGKVTAADARLALRRAVNLETYAPGSREFTACDVTKDSKISAADARKILRGAVGLENPATW